MKTKMSPLHKHIHELELKIKNDNINVQDLVLVFGQESHMLLIFFFILPFLQPIPLFGLSTPFGILIAVITFYSYLKKPPLVPKSWQKKTLNKEILIKIIDASEFLLNKLEKFIQPRLMFLFKQPWNFINTFIIILNALLLALPLPIPFSNALPAWVVFFQAVAHLEKDGALVLISYIQSIITLIYFALLAFGAQSGLEYIKSLLQFI